MKKINKHFKFYSDRIATIELKPLPASIRLILAGSLVMGYVDQGQAAPPALPVASKNWVKSGAATRQILGNTLKINQKSDRAILHWDKFNIGAKNQVKFVQPKATSIALNRIFQNSPSQILGHLNANGQVYLVNQNGFVFGKGSTVNANTLIASALDIKDTVFKGAGITKTFANDQSAALDGVSNRKAEIKIEHGAKVNIGANGRLIMAAPTVTNAGDLEADKYGQIMLIASQDKVYLAENSPSDSAAKSSDFSGLLVEVGTGGKVSNLGKILSRQGNVTMAGFLVNQEGRITATTSAKVNGSIRLLAREGIDPTQGATLAPLTTMRKQDLGDNLGKKATVNFKAGSLTQILADKEDNSAIDEQKQPLSYMQVSAHTIHLQSHSTVKVPGGKIDLEASINPNEPNKPLVDPVTNKPVEEGRILLDKQAKIDVSGYKNINASVSRNIVEVPVQSFELRDSPFQKDGVLQGQTVRVDIRDNTPIVDTAGAEKRIPRSTEERLGNGGSINLVAGGELIANPGATIDISGGNVNYQGGMVNTSKLVTDTGKIVDISDADPNQHYQAVLGTYKEVHQKWGVTQVWHTGSSADQGHFEQGYVQGLDAGVLNIRASKMSWNGDLIAGTKSGLHQRTPDTKAFGGAFNFNAEDNTQLLASTQKIIFKPQADQKPLAVNDDFPLSPLDKDPDDSVNIPSDLVLSTGMFNRSGVQEINVRTFGDALIAKDAHLQMHAGSSKSDSGDKTYNSLFKLSAANVKVEGEVRSPGGSVDISSIATNDIATNNPKAGGLTVGAGGKIDTSGRWVNDFINTGSIPPTEPVTIDAGNISLVSQGDLNLQKGSLLKADGGAWLSQDGDLTQGKAGQITLKTITPNQGGGDQLTSNLTMAGNLSAQGLGQGGKLSIDLGSQNIVIGQHTAGLATADTFLLGVKNGVFDFSGSSGFSDISLTSGFGDVTVKSDTRLNLVQKNLVLDATYKQRASSDTMSGFTRTATLPEYLRTPVDLSLQAQNNLTLETGSKIVADKQASIDLLALPQGSIFIDGQAKALAGNINVGIIPDKSGVPVDYKLQEIWLGQHAQLLASGTTILNPAGSLGLTTGAVLDGGSVNISASSGYLVLEQGSKIDVSGTHSKIDIPVNRPNGLVTKPEVIASNGGTVKLRAAEGIVADGKIEGHAGSASAQGGLLDVQLNRSERLSGDLISAPTGALAINIQQDKHTTLKSSLKFGDNLDDPDLKLNGQAIIGSNQIARGGFSDLRLGLANGATVGGSFQESDKNTSINFIDNVNLSVNGSIDLNAANINWLSDSGQSNGRVNINTAYLRAGKVRASVDEDLKSSLQDGGGVLNTHARWTDFSNYSQWNGFNKLNFYSSHDMRGIGPNSLAAGNEQLSGELLAAGDLTLTASQIYPTTGSKFKFTVDESINPDGKITVKNSGFQDWLPLSAAGELTLTAPVINQGGKLAAPFGKINLSANQSLTLATGSLTTVSGSGLLVPFGKVNAGQNWIYANTVFKAPPEKTINLSSPSVTLQQKSTVDLSGGGDLYAYEFLPGIGGSSDYLGDFTPAPDKGVPNYQGGFAILPSLQSPLAPFDHLQNDLGNYKAAIGKQIYLNGTDKLAAGFYTVLPARYALLPGAFLVTPQAGTQDQQVTSFNAAGLPIIGGYYRSATTGSRDPRWGGFLIETGHDIRKHSQYGEYTANQFFTQRAQRKEIPVPFLPKDSGQIVIKDVINKLTLNGEFKADAPEGKDARMDIAADNLSIVNQLNQNPKQDTLEILASSLSAINIGSLFLGGERSANLDTGVTDLNVRAKTISFENGVHLRQADLIAAATDKVIVKNGATLSTQGNANTGDKEFNIKPQDGTEISDGALLRVSSADQARVTRTQAPGVSGDLVIESGAKLQADKSILLDSTRVNSLAGTLAMQGGSLNLSANTVNLGTLNKDSRPNDLNLSNADLSQLKVDELVLSARNTINFFGDVGIRTHQNQVDPLTFNRLVLNSGNLAGYGQIGDQAVIKADTLTLENTTGANQTLSATGNGQLALTADHFLQGTGKINISGFNGAAFDAGNDFTINGDSNLHIGSDFTLTSGYITADSGKALTLDLAGHRAAFAGNNHKTADTDSNFGGALSVTADMIDFNAQAQLFSGKLSLHALKGDVTLGKNASINLSGQKVTFADTFDYTPGGLLQAMADFGSIVFSQGSLVNLNTGGSTADGGELALSAAKNQIGLFGTVQAQNGSTEIDVAGFRADQNFDQLAHALNTAGITKTFSIRARQEDIIQASDNTIQAETIKLVSDKGDVAISGKLTAGKIELDAGDRVLLNQGGSLNASGVNNNQDGGRVLLTSFDADKDGSHGILLKTGSLIDTQGAYQKVNGSVILRALRTDTNGDGLEDDVAVTDLSGKVTGYRTFFIDAVKHYENADLGNDGSIDSADIAKLKTDTDRYMADSTIRRVASRLGQGFALRPGLAIDYTGDLTLNDEWNLTGWRYHDVTGKPTVPGFLSLSATGNFIIRNDLTDGFNIDKSHIQTTQIFDPITFEIKDVNKIVNRDLLRPDDSWSYQLTAGADVKSADRTATKSDAKNIELKAKNGIQTFDRFNQDLSLLTTVVRTGNGDINLAASGDVIFGGAGLVDAQGNPIFDPIQESGGILKPINFTTSVYVAGKSEAGNAYGSFSKDFVDNFYGTDSVLHPSFSIGEFPIAGGNLFINAKHDIKGALTQYTFQDLSNPWLLKQGRLANLAEFVPGVPTAWSIDFARFSQNIGGFGGGTVALSAGHDISNIGMAMPTTGKAIGNNVFDMASQTFTKIDNKLKVDGGGLFKLSVGGDVIGGSFLLGRGTGEISAGGSIAGSNEVKDDVNLSAIKNLTLGPLLLLGDTQMQLNATKDVTLSSAVDPFVISSGFDANVGAFFSYSANSELRIKSLAENISINKDTASLITTQSSEYFPASLNATAFGGSVLINSDFLGIKLFPSKRGSLNLFARDDISTALDSALITPKLKLTDFDLSLLPTPERPFTPTGAQSTFIEDFPITPVHRGDKEPVRIATLQGDVKNLWFDLAKKTFLSSGRNVDNIKLTIEHANEKGDTSVVSAKNDIVFPTPEAESLAPNPNSIQVAGPGDLVVTAGRNIDLGTSDGLISKGNGPSLDGQLFGVNENLPQLGANITVIAGLQDQSPDYMGFAKLDPEILKYADNFNKYQQLVTEFMRDRTHNTKLSVKTAFEQFRKLEPSQYAAIAPQLEKLASHKYVDIVAQIKATIVSYVREYQQNPALSEAQALTIFKSLAPENSLPVQTALNSLANQILFSELNQTGAASAADPLTGNERGYQAIAALYPGKLWKGDLSMVFSSIQTLQGGNINLLAPGGGINVGLPVAGIDKQDNQLGVIARGQGNVNAFLNDDFNVNQSRVFALGGDDIMIWSSFGDIDAGRGAKSALAVSDPVYNFDEKGNLQVDFPPPVAGSGIRTAALNTSANGIAGNVALFAPGGLVNAGEAGIGGNNVTISATQVLGANNIQVGGVATGVPAASSVSLAAGLTGAGNLAANAAKMAQESASLDDKDDEDEKTKKQRSLSTIKIEVVGFGA